MPSDADEIGKRVAAYYEELDRSLLVLSNRDEGHLSQVPGYALSPRKIVVGVTSDATAVALSVRPDRSLERDELEVRTISSLADASQITPIFQMPPTLPLFAQGPFLSVSSPMVVQTNAPLSAPAFEDDGLYAMGKLSPADVEVDYATEKAKREALELWNMASSGEFKTPNVIHELREVFRKAHLLIRRKYFVERRIHRYVNAHAKILLPAHRRCLFEHRLVLDDDYRKADFILEREDGAPCWLIELESTNHKILTKTGDLTAPANHAAGQINEWVSYIEKDGKANASGEFSFLSGPKQRLVVIGRGLEQKGKLLETQYRDTLFWTYEMLFEQAKMTWNKQIRTQCELIGLPPFDAI